MGSLVAYFNSNISSIDYNSISSEEFNKFNTYFIADAKKATGATVTKNTGGVENRYTIDLKDDTGTTIAVYNYIPKDKSIYRGKVKIARNVVIFSAETSSDPSTTNNKNVITITIGTGTNATRPNFGKTIRYVLKYW